MIKWNKIDNNELKVFDFWTFLSVPMPLIWCMTKPSDLLKKYSNLSKGLTK